MDGTVPPGPLSQEMKRISSKYVMLVTCNNFQPGYSWHRFLHLIFGFPWTHGQVEYNHITRVKKILRHIGMEIVEHGAIDTPGLAGSKRSQGCPFASQIWIGRSQSLPEKPVWEVPILNFIKTDRYPDWMRLLGKWDMLFRKGVVKLPLSHLFYVLGKK